MTRRLLLSSLAALVAGCSTAPNDGDRYEQLVRQFAADMPPDTAQAAMAALRQAGTAAFPALLAHLNDATPAAPGVFQRAELRRESGGTYTAVAPTIGDACFDVLQGQIEGVWPKAYRDYYVVSKQSVHQWLARRPGATLQQLRIDAAQEALRRAEAETPKAGESDFHTQALEFLRKKLEDATRNPA